MTGKITEKLVKKEGNEAQAVLHLVDARRAAPRGRRDDADGPARARTRARRPRYEEKSKGYTLPRPPNFNEADTTDKSANFQAKAPPLTDAQIAQLQLDYEGRAGSMLAVDDHVGELVKTLKRTDQLQATR